MAKLACRCGVLSLAMAAVCAVPVRAQTLPGADTTVQPAVRLSDAAVHVKLRAGEARTVEVAGAAGSLRVVEIRLDGGLVRVRSADAPARLLDLGRGGRLRYALTMDAGGEGRLELRSSEHLRDAELDIAPVTNELSRSQVRSLHVAEIDFAVADMARRHQAGAPSASDALTRYDRAASEAEAAGDLPLRHWVLNQKARFLLYQKSSFVAPRQILLRAAALGDGDAAEQALTYKTLSSCEYFMGHLDAAVDAAERALALYRGTGDVYWQGIVLGNLIADYAEMGRNQDAVHAGREALADAEATEDTAGVVFDLTELANLYRMEGDPQAAFEAFREAAAWSKDIRYAPLVEAEIEQGLGQFYMDMGLWDEAQRQFELCLRMASPESPAALEARTLLAATLAQLGTGARALREYDSAIATAQRLKLAPEETQLRMARSATLLRLGRVDEARRDADEARRAADALKSPALRIGAVLAEAALEARDCSRVHRCAAAEAMYRQAVSTMQQTGERGQEAIAYAGIAETGAGAGRNEAALEAVEHALTLVEGSRASLSSDVLAASYFEEWREWYALAERVALSLDRLHPGAGYREIAFRYSERARARAMFDAIGGDEPRPDAALPPEIRRQVALDEQQIEQDRARLLTTGSAQVADALAHLYREQDEMTAARSRAGVREDVPVAGLDTLERRFLRPDEALIAFATARDRTYRWLVTRSSAQVSEMPGEKELRRRLAPLEEMLVRRGPEPVAGEDAVRYGERLRAFGEARDRELARAGELLLAGLPRGVRHVYVVADGELSSLPWSALRIRCGARACYAAERFAVSMEPSASIAVELARRAPQPARRTVLIVADAAPLRERPGPRWSALEELPGSRREAREIAQLASPASVTMLSGARATPDNVRAQLGPDTAVLHLATHTILVPAHPELSGIALSPGGGTGSGVLWLHDIPSLHAPPLVTLSGCATQGASLDGEGLNTLTEAFFYAGAQQVVASLWSVDDDGTAELMREFYRNLLRGRMDAAEGLRSAQQKMIARHADVADWAAFIVDGVPAEAARN